MEKDLYDSAIEGNVSSLTSLLQHDPLLLHRLPSSSLETPLHVSVLRGHTEFTRALLSHNPTLATESDSLGRLPLHIAAGKGHVEITRELLRVEGGVASCLARDKDGMVPLHVAIAKGARVEVVRELTRASPESTRVRGERGESVYHLCVKCNNLESLKVLITAHNITNHVINELRDDYDNTLLHLAALHQHFEIIKYLLTLPETEPNAVNKNGLTALDLVENSPRDIKSLEILNFLLQSNAQKSNIPLSTTLKSTTQLNNNNNMIPRTSTPSSWKTFFTFNGESRLGNFRGELFIVSAIISLTITLPVINQKINPDGGVLDDDYLIKTLSLLPAVSVMLLLLSGLSLKNKFCVWLVSQLMYTAIGFWGLNYFAAILSHENRYYKLTGTIILMIIWAALLIIVCLLNTIRLIVLIVSTVNGCVTRKKVRGIRKEDASSNV